MRVAALLSVLLAAGAARAAEKWQLQYQYDEDNSSLIITDLQFPTPQNGMAVGYVTENRKTRPSALVTADGGATWTLLRVPRLPLSVFFLNARLGWLATEGGLYQTGDFGRKWTKLDSPKRILRVHFLDESRGWAVGVEKSVYQTTDGGRRWSRVAAADQPDTRRETTVYQWIVFEGKAGIIAGYSQPPRRGENRRLPDWMDPSNQRREWPATSILLETRDGGQTWQSQVGSMFGRITRVRLAPDGRGLGLVEFFDDFEWPSEVFELNWALGKTGGRIFRRQDRAVTDVALLPAGPAYLAAVEPQGKMARLPVPGKLRLLRSDNLKDWNEMQVDYRAVARRAMLAASGPGQLWVATDTGMILKLASE
jgi:hypothetical protein